MLRTRRYCMRLAVGSSRRRWVATLLLSALPVVRCTAGRPGCRWDVDRDPAARLPAQYQRGLRPEPPPHDPVRRIEHRRRAQRRLGARARLSEPLAAPATDRNAAVDPPQPHRRLRSDPRPHDRVRRRPHRPPHVVSEQRSVGARARGRRRTGLSSLRPAHRRSHGSPAWRCSTSRATACSFTAARDPTGAPSATCGGSNCRARRPGSRCPPPRRWVRAHSRPLWSTRSATGCW